MRVSQLLRNCAVFIGMVGADGNFIPYGTGFLIATDLEKVIFGYVTTCKHVIDEIIDKIGGDRVWIRANTRDGNATEIITDIQNWVYDDTNDVAIYCHYFNPTLYELTYVRDISFATKEKIKELKIEPGEMAFLVGLFLSHYGSKRNMPIVRMGNIAAIPEEPVLTSVGYIKGYLVEMRSIGGFSGSPVLVTILPCRVIDKKVVFGGKMETLLLGMMQGLYVLKEPSIAIEPGDSKADAMNAGIGIVIPIDTIMKTINEPLLLEQREKTLKQIKKEAGVRPAVARSIPSTDNPQHKEDFNSLVTAATKKKLQDD